MRRMTTSLLLLVPLLLGACELPTLGSDEPAEPQRIGPGQARSAEAQIGQLRDKWVEAIRAGNGAAVAELYAEDAVMVGLDGRVLEGRQAIQSGLPLQGLASIELTSTDQELGGEVASDMGTFTQAFQTPMGPRNVAGRYVVVLRLQQDGAWKIAQHVVTAGQEVAAADTTGADTTRVATPAPAETPRETPRQPRERILGTPIPPGN